MIPLALWFPFLLPTGSDALIAGRPDLPQLCTLIVIVHVAPFGHVCLSLGGGETPPPPPFANVVISGYVQFDRWGGGERKDCLLEGACKGGWREGGFKAEIHQDRNTDH